MKELRIRWQRLVDESGNTCDRCGMTEAAVDHAVSKLTPALAGLGIAVVLKKETLAPAQFLEDTLQSNRVWIAEEPLEHWLSATSGQSKCCSACGDSDCRTVTVNGQTFEAIPEELIVRAALRAAADIIQAGSQDGDCGEAGCGSCTQPETSRPVDIAQLDESSRRADEMRSGKVTPMVESQFRENMQRLRGSLRPVPH